eukprot:SM000090S24303  [mRNA]  locus=s90:164584:174618:- [translate_table: standard]
MSGSQSDAGEAPAEGLLQAAPIFGVPLRKQQLLQRVAGRRSYGMTAGGTSSQSSSSFPDEDGNGPSPHRVSQSGVRVVNDILLQMRRAELIEARRHEAAAFIANLLGDITPSKPSEEEFRRYLRNGTVLCRLVNVALPGSKCKVCPTAPLSRIYQCPLHAQISAKADLYNEQGASHCNSACAKLHSMLTRVVHVQVAEGQLDQSVCPSGPFSPRRNIYHTLENLEQVIKVLRSIGAPAFQIADIEKEHTSQGATARVVDSVLALKSYYTWQRAGHTGIWTHVPSLKSPKEVPRWTPAGNSIQRQTGTGVYSPKFSCSRALKGPSELPDNDAPPIQGETTGGTPEHEPVEPRFHSLKRKLERSFVAGSSSTDTGAGKQQLQQKASSHNMQIFEADVPRVLSMDSPPSPSKASQSGGTSAEKTSQLQIEEHAASNTLQLSVDVSDDKPGDHGSMDCLPDVLLTPRGLAKVALPAKSRAGQSADGMSRGVRLRSLAQSSDLTLSSSQRLASEEQVKCLRDRVSMEEQKTPSMHTGEISAASIINKLASTLRKQLLPSRASIPGGSTLKGNGDVSWRSSCTASETMMQPAVDDFLNSAPTLSVVDVFLGMLKEEFGRRIATLTKHAKSLQTDILKHTQHKQRLEAAYCAASRSLSKDKHCSKEDASLASDILQAESVLHQLYHDVEHENDRASRCMRELDDLAFLEMQLKQRREASTSESWQGSMRGDIRQGIVRVDAKMEELQQTITAAELLKDKEEERLFEVGVALRGAVSMHRENDQHCRPRKDGDLIQDEGRANEQHMHEQAADDEKHLSQCEGCDGCLKAFVNRGNQGQAGCTCEGRVNDEQHLCLDEVSTRGTASASSLEDTAALIKQQEVTRVQGVAIATLFSALQTCQARTLKGKAAEKQFQKACEDAKECSEQHRKDKQMAEENLCEAHAQNRLLYNQIQDLKGSIRVYCRIRPPQLSSTQVIHIMEDNETVSVRNPTLEARPTSKEFHFDGILGPSSCQDDVYIKVKPLLRSVLDGYNVCVIAYGQTGSGPDAAEPKDRGLIFRALADLFQLSEERVKNIKFSFQVQMLEVYNEQVRDLLAQGAAVKKYPPQNSSTPVLGSPDMHRTKLRMKLNDNFDVRSLTEQFKLEPRATADAGAVCDATTVAVSNPEQILQLMELGSKQRASGATALNIRSSRSHSIVTVQVLGREERTNLDFRGALQLVDLAGSERVAKSEATGERLKEAQNINRSLSALGDVISSLAQKSAHIPYRNSKLTQILYPSLGGGAKTLMLVHVSPDVNAYDESISTLLFAERVASVELGSAKSNQAQQELQKLRQQVARLKEAAHIVDDGKSSWRATSPRLVPDLSVNRVHRRPQGAASHTLSPRNKVERAGAALHDFSRDVCSPHARPAEMHLSIMTEDLQELQEPQQTGAKECQSIVCTRNNIEAHVEQPACPWPATGNQDEDVLKQAVQHKDYSRKPVQSYSKRLQLRTSKHRYTDTRRSDENDSPSTTCDGGEEKLWPCPDSNSPKLPTPRRGRSSGSGNALGENDANILDGTQPGVMLDEGKECWVSQADVRKALEVEVMTVQAELNMLTQSQELRNRESWTVGVNVQSSDLSRDLGDSVVARQSRVGQEMSVEKGMQDGKDTHFTGVSGSESCLLDADLLQSDIIARASSRKMSQLPKPSQGRSQWRNTTVGITNLPEAGPSAIPQPNSFRRQSLASPLRHSTDDLPFPKRNEQDERDSGKRTGRQLRPDLPPQPWTRSQSALDRSSRRRSEIGLAPSVSVSHEMPIAASPHEAVIPVGQPAYPKERLRSRVLKELVPSAALPPHLRTSSTEQPDQRHMLASLWVLLSLVAQASLLHKASRT